jgi:predicted Zn-dependent peptidase
VLFKGTPRRTAEQISAAIESVGGELNAYTAKEHTCFYARVLHSDAELALDVLTDMITNSLVTAEDIDAERAVILDEISMHADDPTELAADAAAAAISASPVSAVQ